MTCNPVFNQELTLTWDGKSSLNLTVFDHDTFTADDFLASTKLNYIQLSEIALSLMERKERLFTIERYKSQYGYNMSCGITEDSPKAKAQIHIRYDITLPLYINRTDVMGTISVGIEYHDISVR
jgi:hypothetical protein